MNCENQGYEVEDIGLIYEDLMQDADIQKAADWSNGNLPCDKDAVSDETNMQEVFMSADEALTKCLNKCTWPDMCYLMKHTGMEREELAEELHLYQDPMAYDLHQDSDKDWYRENEYISSGKSVGTLLKEAKEMNEKYDGRFARNVAYLKVLMPDKAFLEEVYIPLGSRCVSNYQYAEFIAFLLDMNQLPVIKRKKLSRKRKIEEVSPPVVTLNTVEFGTERMPAVKLIEHVLNETPIKVKDPRPRSDGRKVDYVINPEETQAALDKLELIFAKFQEWIYADKERAEQIRKKYFETYGTYVTANYDGGYLKFPDLNPLLVLYRHQRNGIARILCSRSRNTLLVYDTGAGKTYTMICAAHELKRMHIVRKAMFVLQSAFFESFVADHRYAYPEDKLLVVSEDKFSKNERAKTIEEMKHGDYDAIYIRSSSYDMLDLSKDYYISLLNADIKKYKQQMEDCYGFEKKHLQKKVEKIQKEIQALKDAEEPIEHCWESLGVDCLFIDECHTYKNINVKSSLENVVGLHRTGSIKCERNLHKVHYVQQLTESSRVVFSSATPVKNSIADVYAMQMYLQPDMLEFLDIKSFDEWAAVFCEVHTQFEISPDAMNYRNITRLTFHNIPELIQIFSSVADFYHADREELQLPETVQYQDIVVPKTKEQHEVYNEIARKLELVHLKVMSRKEYNELLACMEARLATTDIRLSRPNAVVAKHSTKISYCVEEVYKNYVEHPGTAQIIFSDIGVPKKDCFNVYDQLKLELIERGVPANEIAFIHEGTTDKKRAKLLEDLNQAKIRVMIGSTSKLGLGVNAQLNLYALHHLDAPWSPADVQQREGRLVRMGNKNESVKIYRYIAGESFDAYIWQVLDNKAQFIFRFLSAGFALMQRDVEDIAYVALSYSEVKALALGSVLLRKRVETQTVLERCKIKSRQRKNELSKCQTMLHEIPLQIAECTKRMDTFTKDLECYKAYKEVVTQEERLALGEELLYEIVHNVNVSEERCFDVYQGFDVILPKYMKEEEPHVFLERHGRYLVPLKNAKELGCSKRFDNVLEKLSDKIKKEAERIKFLETERHKARKEIRKGNPMDEKIDAVVKELEQIDKQLEEELLKAG